MCKFRIKYNEIKRNFSNKAQITQKSYKTYA